MQPGVFDFYDFTIYKNWKSWLNDKVCHNKCVEGANIVKFSQWRIYKNLQSKPTKYKSVLYFQDPRKPWQTLQLIPHILVRLTVKYPLKNFHKISWELFSGVDE